jgi:hypothetical protein
MTLKEKFLPKMYCFMGSGMLSNSYDENVAEGNATECEQLADEFAIGFAEWCKQEYELEDTSFHNKWRDVNGEYRESKELLEIYKKEKGL